MAQKNPFDTANIQCYVPTGCCVLDPCKVTVEDFICAIRSLLPEGPLFTTTLPGAPPPTPPAPPGVGCYTVGCTVVCDGLEILDPQCTNDPQHMQINLTDVYAATAFTAVEALCDMLRELDPCTADTTVDCWLARYGVRFGDCDPVWGADTKKLLLCLLAKLSHGYVLNKATLDAVAAYFGVVARIFNAGDFNCTGIPGRWTLGRSRRNGTPVACIPVDSCDPDSEVLPPGPQPLTFNPPCTIPPTIDIVICQAETAVPGNCLLPGVGYTVAPSAELFDAFEWLLKRMLSRGVDICVYRCEDAPCLEID